VDWRGWRLIVVNGQRFRWQEIAWAGVRVRSEDVPARVLVVPEARHAVPGLVAAWIEVALGQGWPEEVANLELPTTLPNDPTTPDL
jgi:hypothetical protein